MIKISDESDTATITLSGEALLGSDISINMHLSEILQKFPSITFTTLTKEYLVGLLYNDKVRLTAEIEKLKNL